MIAFLVRFSTRQPGVVIALALAVLFLGLMALGRASLDVFPEFSPVQVVIQTEGSGMSAGQVEALLTRPIESALAGVTAVRTMRSQSIPGLSVVTLVFQDGTDIYRNRQLVAERMTALASLLPAGVVPAITPLTSSASTILGIGIHSRVLDLRELRSLVDWTLRPHLLAAEGVADVNVFGGDVAQWEVRLDPARLAALRIGFGEAVAAVRQAGGVRSAGFVEGSNQRLMIELDGAPASLAELGGRLVASRAEGPVRLRDLGEVVVAAAPAISGASSNGEPGILLMVQGQLGANTRAVTLSVERALREVQPVLEARQVAVEARMFRPANFIDVAIGNVQRDILAGSVLVVGVLFLFLFNVRTALISATAIPLSLLSAILVLQAFRVPLNIMVLGGLAIALGEVVDDAIIDSENIFRRLRENRSAAVPRPLQLVVFDASLEVRSSVVFATFIVALVFVPLLTLSGVAGRLFAPLGYAYILAILSSLVVAVTLTPALSLLLLGSSSLTATDPPLIAWIRPRYLRLLGLIDRRPWPALTLTAVLLCAGMALIPLFGGEFIPPLKEGHFIVHMTLIPGTSARETLRVGDRVAAAIHAVPGVRSVAQWVGRAPNGADTAGVHYSEFEIELDPLDGAGQTRVLAAIRALIGGGAGEGHFAGGNFAVNTFLTERIEETVSGYAAALVVNIHGPDLDGLDHDAQQVAQLLAAVPGADDVQLQAPPGFPEFRLQLRPERLAEYGFAAGDVIDTVQTALQGRQVGEIRQSERQLPLVVRAGLGEGAGPDAIGALMLLSPDGRPVRLDVLARLSQQSGRYKVLHLDGKRVQTVTANVRGRDLEAFTADVRARLATRLHLMPGDYVVISGDAEAEAQARRDLVVQALVCGLGIMLLLYLAFARLRPLVVTLLNLPFALLGGVVAVLFTGGWLSLGSLVGFVTLFGITLRNSIMLVSHYQYLTTHDGLPWNADTARRGAAERLPSILMTALVTGLGLLPLALGSGEPGREIEGPMASIIVGGLVTSTLLNLLILPAVLLHFGRFGASGNPAIQTETHS
ncbi:MAG: efflux RND transporter permease subunit [Pseudomonadota bacterium]|nr:efflux RND transporter permease subunit [Pseudomonadota bacterium]